MKPCLLVLAIACSLSFVSYSQTATNVVISQVYGGGGNTGAQYRYDFVELYNPTSNPINLSGWTLLYAGETSANWSKMSLSGSLLPGRYFLIQLKSGGSNGVDLPAPNQTFNIDLSASGGKLLLLNADVSVSNDACPSIASIIDKVGYGSKANCVEAAAAPALSNTTAIFRKSNGCTDINNNALDFFELAPSPRNSASPAHNCGTSITVTGIAVTPFCVDAANGASGSISYSITGGLPQSLAIYLSDATGSFGNSSQVGTAAVMQNTGTAAISLPANLSGSTLYRLRADADNSYGEVSSAFEIINGTKNGTNLQAFPDHDQMLIKWINPVGCFDELMLVAKPNSSITGVPAGDGADYTANLDYSANGTDFDGGKIVYKGNISSQTISGLTDGTLFYFKLFARRGNNWSSGVEVSAIPRWAPARGEVIINQFSPGYNGVDDEYFELVNLTGKSFDLADLNISYQSSTGNTRIPTGLNGMLQPYSFWLLIPTTNPPQSPITVGKTMNLPRDGASGAAIAANGHIALTRKGLETIIDAVAYGMVSGGTFIEGSPAPSPPLGTGLRRKIDGMDNNQNSTDFIIVANADIDLRNSTSRLANTGANIPAGNYARMYVTGNSTIAGNITLSEKVVLAGGKLSLNSANLTVNTTEGGSADSYVQTNNTGVLAAAGIGAAGFLFPVGNSTYNPLTLAKGSGQSWWVRVQDGVQAIGWERAVLRTWHISPAATPASGASLTFQYNEGDATQLGPNFTAEDGIQTWHYQNNWQKAGPVLTATGIAGSWRTVTLDNWSQFSPFVLTSASAVLPVRFSSVRLFQSGHSRVLSFITHNETNINRYEVEWSANGTDFRSISSILPRNNKGGTEPYTFQDHRIITGVHFFRVKAVEETGALFYSPVLAWSSRAGATELRVFPSPVSRGTVNYSIDKLARGNYRVQVLDAIGRQVWVKNLTHHGGMATGAIPLQPAQKGWYVLVLNGPQQIRKAFLVE